MEAAGCWVGPGLGAEMETSARTHGASQVAVVVRNPPANAGDIRDMGSIPGLSRDMGLIPGGGHLQPTSVVLPGESLWTEKPVGYSP